MNGVDDDVAGTAKKEKPLTLLAVAKRHIVRSTTPLRTHNRGRLRRPGKRQQASPFHPARAWLIQFEYST
jgi:hypothetical protein